MRETMNELHDLLRAKIDCIWIQSFEEKEVLHDIKQILNGDAHFSNMQLLLWSHTEGVTPLAKNEFMKDGQPDLKLREFPALFSKMRTEQNTEAGKQNLWVLRDFHQVIGDNKCQRYIRDLKEYRSRNYNPIVVISPALDIPSDIAHLFRVINYGLPEEKEIHFIVDKFNKKLAKASQKNPDKGIKPLKADELRVVERVCSGLTVKEMDMALRECSNKYRTLNPEFLAKNKIETVKKTGVLDYKIPHMTLDDIGGNQAIKDWLYESVNAFDEKATEFGLDKPKGAMLVGIPGCGKTAIAEAFAGMTHMPLLSLSMSKILDRMVGQSERKIEHALQVVRACAPCILLVDECEKLLGGKLRLSL